MIDDKLLFERAQAYAKSRQLLLDQQQRFGYGSDGSVWKSNRPSAIKALYRPEVFQTELRSYQRLAERRLTKLCGFAVPLLTDFDESLQVLEISIVQPPYLLDFGKVYLDAPPPYFHDPQLRANAEAEWRERYGHRWLEVRRVLAALQQFGIYHVDPRPSNIAFAGDWEQDEPDDDRFFVIDESSDE